MTASGQHGVTRAVHTNKTRHGRLEAVIRVFQLADAFGLEQLGSRGKVWRESSQSVAGDQESHNSCYPSPPFRPAPLTAEQRGEHEARPTNLFGLEQVERLDFVRELVSVTGDRLRLVGPGGEALNQIGPVVAD